MASPIAICDSLASFLMANLQIVDSYCLSTAEVMQNVLHDPCFANLSENHILPLLRPTLDSIFQGLYFFLCLPFLPSLMLEHRSEERVE